MPRLSDEAIISLCIRLRSTLHKRICGNSAGSLRELCGKSAGTLREVRGNSAGTLREVRGNCPREVVGGSSSSDSKCQRLAKRWNGPGMPMRAIEPQRRGARGSQEQRAGKAAKAGIKRCDRKAGARADAKGCAAYRVRPAIGTQSAQVIGDAKEFQTLYPGPLPAPLCS